MKRFLGIIFLSIFSLVCTAQNVGIGTTTPNANAILEIKDASKGVLMPRMDSATRKSIPNTVGMLVYDSSAKSYWYNNGTIWVNHPPAGNSVGDMLYWNGTFWKALPAGAAGQYLTFLGGLPTWAGNGSGSIVISTAVVTNVALTTATSGGSITSDGGSAITARGIVWSTSPSPTIALPTKTSDGTGIGTFVSSITGLTASTTYYVRAYATNTNGTSYGNQITFNTNGNFTIGQSYGGGIIFYIDGTGQHGLIAAPADQSTGCTWDNNTHQLTTASGLAIGTGSNNTTIIIAHQGTGYAYAATLCRTFYNGGGFSDWYLPSLLELDQLVIQRDIVGGFDQFSNYWSSSEIDINTVWVANFSSTTPNQNSYQKYNPCAARAIRSF